MRCHFIPPYLLTQLQDTADSAPLRSTLVVDEQLRQRRDEAPRTLMQPAASTGGTRVVHDARNVEQLPGAVVRTGDQPATGDAAVDEAHDYSGLVWELFAEQFGRPSVDGRGTALSLTVHYGQDYDNAFWDGTQLVFGDGDGVIFDRFTKPLDVLAHEFTHGVTQFTAGLTYQGQSGALNESVSDVFASMTKQKHLDQTADQADWLIGQGIFLPGVEATALRSMTAPGTAYDDPRLGKDPQVENMADYVDSADDSGGVHINSGIPNRAFALAAIAIGGRSWEHAGHVWYDALTAGEVGAQTDFTGFARATVSSAGRLYPDDPSVAEHVRRAWTTVGVPVDAPSPPGAGQGTDASSSSDVAPNLVAVTRSGGFTGAARSAELDLDQDPAGPEVRELLTGVDLRALTAGTPAPDRFVYTLAYGEHAVTLPEQDLSPELHRVVQLVLKARDESGLTLS